MLEAPCIAMWHYYVMNARSNVAQERRCDCVGAFFFVASALNNQDRGVNGTSCVLSLCCGCGGKSTENKADITKRNP